MGLRSGIRKNLFGIPDPGSKRHRIPDNQHWQNQKGNACLDSSRHRRRPDRLHTAAEDRMGFGPCPARPAALCTRQHYDRAAPLQRWGNCSLFRTIKKWEVFLGYPQSRHITLILGKYHHNYKKDSSPKKKNERTDFWKRRIRNFLRCQKA